MAAGDLTLTAMLVGIDGVSPVVASMASTFDASIGAMDSTAATLSGSLDALDASISTLDASLASIDATASTADASLGGLDASLASVGASLDTIDASSAGADAALSGLDAAAAGVDASLATTGESAGTLGGYLASLGDQVFTLEPAMAGFASSVYAADASLSGLDAAAATADASLAGIDASATTVDTSLSGIDASAAAADASLGGLDASVSSVDAYLSSFSATAESTAVTMGMMGVSADSVDAALAGIDAATAAADASLSGIDASAAAADASLGGLDASLAGTSASMAGVSASAAATDASLAATAAAADAAAASERGAALSLDGLTGSFGMVKTGIELVGVAMAVIGVKMAGDFQTNILKLYTTAGEAHNALQMVGDGILAMSTQVGTGALKLSQAMYWIESAGLHGKQGLDALRVAAQAAKAENANLDQVSIALAASLNAYAGSGMTTVQVMNTLTAATGQGMMTFEQLSGSLASVLPAAAKFHVSLANVTAALATMTAQGDPAEQAATHLKQVLLALEAPSKIGAAALKSVGLTSQQVSDEMKQSLPGALQMITDAVGKKFPEGSAAYNQAIKNIAGGSKQMMGFLELTGTHLDTFAANVKKISGAVKAGGNDLMGWSDIQQNFNFKLDQAKAALETMAITLGTKLLPVLGPIVSGFSGVVGGLTHLISSGGQLSPIFSNISGMVRIMAGNFRDFGAQVGPLLSGPLMQFGHLMGQLLPGFISQFLRAIDLVQLVFLDVARSVSTLVGPALSILGQWFKGVQGVIENVLSTIEGQFIPALHNLLTVIAPIIRGILQWAVSSNILGIAFNIISVVVQIVIGAISTLINILAAVINFFANTALGAAMFKAILIVLAVAIGAIGIVIMSIVIPAFVAWVIGAVAVGIANVIAFAPIVLIILAIVAVVTVVILIITHWGQIISWLGGLAHTVFSAIGSFIGGVFSAIGTFVHNLITGFQHLGGAFNIIKVLAIIAFFPIIVIVGLVIAVIHHWGAIMAWFGGIFSQIGTGVRHELSNIGQTFSLLGSTVQRFLAFMKPAFDGFGSVVHAVAGKVGDFFSMLGSGAHAAATAIGNFFSMLGTGVHAAVTAIGNFFGMIGNFLSPIVNFATMVVHWFTWLWDTLVGHSIIPEMIAAIGRAFLKLLSNIPIVGGMVQGVIGLFSHMADAITNKTEQLRIAQQQKLVQMRLDTDKQTMLGAAAAIANLEHERVGILEKLKTCHSQAERNELEYQLKMTDTQIQNQQKRLQEAEKDKNAQLAKQKQLHDQALEAQKWFGQRFLDMMGSWIGDQFNKLGTMVSGWMSKLGQWKDQAVTKATEMVTNFTSMIAELPGKVGGWIANMATTVLGKLASLASDALSAGAHIVQQIASGIIGGIGSFLGNAMSQVGSFIHDHLPFSPAKRGPLRDLPYQGALISKQIADGIVTGMPHIQRAMLALSSEMIKGTVLSGTQAQLGGKAFTLSGSASGSGGGYTTMNLTIKLDSREIAEAVGIRLAKEVRINGRRNS